MSGLADQQRSSVNLLSGVEASQYLKDRHGQTVSPATLAKWRCVGGGPIFYPNNGRPRYTPSDLDRFAADRLGSPVQSTSEYAGRAA